MPDNLKKAEMGRTIETRAKLDEDTTWNNLESKDWAHFWKLDSE